MAEYFQITDLKRSCQEYLYSVELTTENCVQLCLLCSLYDLELYTRAFDFLRGHLPEVMKTSDIMTLTHESVISLLKDETLRYVSQEDFFDFVVKWVNNDLECRGDNFSELFCALDLLRVSKEVLETKIEEEPLVKKFEECVLHVLNVKMKYMTGLLPNDSGEKECILLAGGCGHHIYLNNLFHLFPDSISVNNIYGYIINEERWTELAPLPHQMRKPIITFDPSGHLYVFDTNHSHDSSMFYVYKFQVVNQSWTSFKIKVPESCTNASIQNIIACGGHLYAVMSGHFVGRAPGGMDNWQTIILQAKEDDTESEIKCYLFARNISTQIVSCAMNNSKICVLAWKIGFRAKKKKHNAKFIVYDTADNKRIDESKGVSWEPYMFPFEDEIMVCKMGKFQTRKFSFSKRLWYAVKEQFLPHPPQDGGRTDFSFVANGEDLFIFGGKDPLTKKPLDTGYKFSLKSKTWTKLENMPQALMLSASCVAKLPADQVKCHISCPHCSFETRKSQAIYNVEYPYDEDDYDEYTDYSYDDDDFPSDNWDDYHDCDPYDPYDDMWFQGI